MATDGHRGQSAGARPASSSAQPMEILRVFNNNVVLASDAQGREYIVTGRGLGFGTRPGNMVDQTKIGRLFVPSDGRDPDHLAEMLAGIAPEQVHIVSEALAEVGLDARASAKPTLVIALADHIGFALKRVKLATHIEYPLKAEVEHLYGEEYAQGQALLAAINSRVGEVLPESEAVAITLHLVNAGFATGDLTYTYAMTGIIQQMLAVISESYQVPLASSSISVARFITHLRYLFVRIHQDKQLDDHRSGVGAAIRQAYPEALACARRVANVVEVRLGAHLTSDEMAYLALHVARVTDDQP